MMGLSVFSNATRVQEEDHVALDTRALVKYYVIALEKRVLYIFSFGRADGSSNLRSVYRGNQYHSAALGRSQRSGAIPPSLKTVR